MTIDIVHSWINFITNKAQGSYFSPQEIDDALDRAQMKYFNEQYAQYALAQKIQDSLSPFKAIYTFLTSDSPAGLVTAPSTYQYLLGGHIIIVDGAHNRYRSLKVLSEDELGYRLDSQLRPVSLTRPVATIAGPREIQLYPKQPMAGELFYLRRPLAPVFAFTQAGRVITYDDSTSVQLEWAESELSEIIIRALEFLGVSIGDQGLLQYSDAKSKEIS